MGDFADKDTTGPTGDHVLKKIPCHFSVYVGSYKNILLQVERQLT